LLERFIKYFLWEKAIRELKEAKYSLGLLEIPDPRKRKKIKLKK
jgi:hypothetical protein